MDSKAVIIQNLTIELNKKKLFYNQLRGSYDHLKKVHEKMVKELRDAEVYIQVLEDENEIFQQRISELEGGK